MPSVEQTSRRNNVLTDVLKFAANHIMLLDKHNQYWQTDDPGPFTMKDKIILETSLLVYLLHRDHGRERRISRQCRKLLTLLSVHVSDAKTKATIHKNPHLSYVLGLSYICLSKMGYKDPDYAFLLERVSDLQKYNLKERLPFRRLDIDWVEQLHHPSKIPLQKGDFSILNAKTFPAYMERMDAYAVTHAIMYLSDFGRSYGALRKETDLAHLYRVLDAALTWCLLYEDLDLISELLLSYFYCRFKASPKVIFAYELLLRYWKKMSFLPSPTFVYDKYEKLPKEEQRAYYYHHVYHTTYVFALCVSAKQRYDGVRRKADYYKWTAGVGDLALAGVSRAMTSAGANRVAAFLSDQYGLTQADMSLSPDVFLVDSFEATLLQIWSELQTNGMFLQALKTKFPGGDQRMAIAFESTVIYAIREYKLEVLVHVLCLAAVNAPELVDHYVFREAIAFLLVQQTAAGAIGTYFYEKENLTVNREATIGYHCKVMFLLGGCYDELEEK